MYLPTRILQDGNASSVTPGARPPAGSRNREKIIRGIASRMSIGKSSSLKMGTQGYDREAYEHGLEIGRKKISKSIPLNEEIMKPPPVQLRATYIFKLEVALDTLVNVQCAAGMSESPVAIQEVGEDGYANFCRINGDAREAITTWIAAQQITIKPTVPSSEFTKRGKIFSIYPTFRFGHNSSSAS